MPPHGNDTEKFTTPSAELAHLSDRAHKEYILQNEAHKTLEDAARASVESYARAEARDFLHETTVLPKHETESLVLKLKPEAHDTKMEELFGIMLSKGVKNALDVVKQMNDSHLEDDFHRFLVQYLHTIGALPGIKESSSLYKELEHSLFTVTLPPRTDTADFKSFIQAMKQFYAGMLALCENSKSYYTLELAVQNHGRDIALYASVPRVHEQTFEKLVSSYYPGASIEEVVDDYNIFTIEGNGIAASTAQLSEPAIFPLASDESFSHDPLVALIGSLSKLEQQGEGAAIQVTIAADTANSNRLYTSIIDAAQQGDVEVKKQYKELTEGMLTSLGKGVLSFFTTDTPKESDSTKEKVVDTRGIELARIKNQSQSLKAGIRIITAAPTLLRAQAMLSSIKTSFAQYALVESNSIKWNDIATARIHAVARDFSFRTINDAELMTLSVNELATLFHFPVGLTAASELKEVTTASAPAPSTMQNSGGVYLGTNTYRGTTTDIFLSKEDRVRHCYVVGQTGTGKTTILKNMVIQDIKNGNGVCFIDPHGSDLQDILANIPPERLDDVIYFDPAYTERPMGLNMLEYDVRFPEQKIFVINELMGIFNKLFDMKTAGGPMFEQYFRNSAGLVMEDPESGSTLLEIGRVLSNKAFREMKLSKCKNPIIKQFWENAEKTTGEASLANFVPYITNKFDVFISNDIMRPVIAQQHSVLNFRDIMDNKKILLVNLSKGRLGDINSHLIGLVLVGKLTMAALSRVDMVGRGPINDFYLYIDEFQNVTTDSIATILSEARKYRLALTVAHQYIEQLEENIKDAVFGNVGSMIIYRVSPENAAMFEKQLSPTFTPNDILTLQNFNAIAKILVNGVPEKPFNLRIPPPPVGNMEITEKVKQLSYLKYGRPRAEVEAEIFARYK
ncbi:MAG: type IV secretory system conjugative DNA transfer family protein [Minisyncoccia bacterium]